jgi:hypothetical protein
MMCEVIYIGTYVQYNTEQYILDIRSSLTH